ncbi:hypothetical protein AB0H71_23655 [Nocardia sp. NPDC050697]|uniref:hypothetical protein n=1 Tax=Nocardia sp. NPDC050697 TaxID=3155158 RepID=UPI0033D878B8
MSTDQNSTRDRSRDQVRISGGPGAPGSTTEPSVTEDDRHPDDFHAGAPGTRDEHAPTDPGTDGTHTATSSDVGGTHDATASGTHGTHTSTASDVDGTHDATHGTYTSTGSDADGTHSSTGSALDPDDHIAGRSHDEHHSTVVTDDAATADGLSGKPTITADPAVSGEPSTGHHPDHEPGDVEPHSATVSREPAVPATTATTPESADTGKPLFDRDLLDVLNTRWKEVQGSFVDNPHDAVTRADLLVAETVEQITTRWSEHQQQLQGRWSRGTDGDTENLRQALRDYRTFFQKLLTLGE